MPRDAYNVFSDAQTLIINAGANAQSTNVLDLDQAAGKDWKGTARTPDPAAALGTIEVRATTALDAAVTGAVLTIALYEHTAATTINAGNLIASKAITVTDDATVIPAGTVLWRYRINPDEVDERYLGLDYSVATQNIAAGACDAALLLGVEKQYP